MTREGVTYLQPEEAKAIIEAAAFTDEETGRRTVHCFLGAFGADWDVADIHAAIDRAILTDGVPQVGWTRNILKHDLALLSRDAGDAPDSWPKLYRFGVTMPGRE